MGERGRSDERRSTPGGGRLAVGLTMVLLGIWFGLDRLGFERPDLGDLWPLVVLLAGLAPLVAFVMGGFADPGLVFPGTVGVLMGIFFGLFTLGPLAWDEMLRLWPILPLVAGVAFLLTWIAGRCRQGGLLIPAALGVAVGVVGLASTYGLISEWLVPLVELAWPVALIVLGVLLVWQSLRRGTAAC